MVLLSGSFDGNGDFKDYLSFVMHGLKHKGVVNMYGQPTLLLREKEFFIHFADYFPHASIFGLFLLAPMFLFSFFSLWLTIIAGLMISTYWLHTNHFHRVLFRRGLKKRGVTGLQELYKLDKAVERLVKWDK